MRYDRDRAAHDGEKSSSATPACATATDETSIRVNSACDLELFGLDRSVVRALGTMTGPCLRLLM